MTNPLKPSRLVQSWRLLPGTLEQQHEREAMICEHAEDHGPLHTRRLSNTQSRSKLIYFRPRKGVIYILGPIGLQARLFGAPGIGVNVENSCSFLADIPEGLKEGSFHACTG